MYLTSSYKKHCIVGILFFIVIFTSLSQTSGLQRICFEQCLPPKTLSISDSIQDLNFLDSVICNKEIVLIGESSHGIDEFSRLKYKLIKYLNEKHNFEILVFESGMSECAFVNANLSKMNPKESIKGIFSVWQTESNLVLMKFLKTSNMKVFGIDFQYSTNYYSKFLYSIAGKLKNNLSSEIIRLDTSLTNSVFNNKLYADTTNNVFKGYVINRNNYRKRMQQLQAAVLSSAIPEQDKKLIKKVIQNKLLFFNNIPETRQRLYSRRDSVMFDNLLWITDTLQPKKKVIIWAHNAHISKTGAQNPSSYLGNLIAKKFGAKSAAIGLYAYSGQASDNFGKGIIAIPKMKGSVEDIIYENFNGARLGEQQSLFLSLLNCSPVGKYQWIQQKNKAYGWGFMPIIPSEEYDALILVKRATVPKYIN